MNFLERFPVMGIGPSDIPAKFVYAHSSQCMKNHSQSVHALARRGGLDWTELFAVLHDLPYRSMNEQEAMDLCLQKMDDPYQGQRADRVMRINNMELQGLEAGTSVTMPRMRLCWLNIETGEFSESWPSEESPPEAVIQANYANDNAPQYRLIEFRCVNKPAFAFDQNMKLR